MNPLTVFPVLVFLRYLPRGILGWDGNGIRVYILNRNVTRREAEDRLGSARTTFGWLSLVTEVQK